MRKKVSFDFDACLDTDQVFEYAQELKLRDEAKNQNGGLSKYQKGNRN